MAQLKPSLVKFTIPFEGDEYLYSFLEIRDELEILKLVYPKTIKDYNFYNRLMIVTLDKESASFDDCKRQIN